MVNFGDILGKQKIAWRTTIKTNYPTPSPHNEHKLNPPLPLPHQSPPVPSPLRHRPIPHPRLPHLHIPPHILEPIRPRSQLPHPRHSPIHMPNTHGQALHLARQKIRLRAVTIKSPPVVVMNAVEYIPQVACKVRRTCGEVQQVGVEVWLWGLD